MALPDERILFEWDTDPEDGPGLAEIQLASKEHSW
jgi:hypothetical protein